MDRRSLLLGRRPTEAPAPAEAPAVAPVAARPAPRVVPTAGGLAPFAPTAQEPWDARRARHLLRRATLSATPDAVAAALAQTPAQAAHGLVDAALAAGLPPTPDYAALVPPPAGASAEAQQAYTDANNAAFRSHAASVVAESLGRRAPGSALNERMALVWHATIPASRQASGQTSRLYSYWTVLRRNALGSFEALVREVGLAPLMLVYLNGNQNRRGSPNENYARELLELFTLGVAGPDGQPTYTQADIADLARALTGWQTPAQQTDAVFNPARFDAGDKTLFGQTGPFGYAEAHDVLFAQRRTAIAHHAARRIYTAFVAATPNEHVVADLAAVLLAGGLQIAPAVRALLASQHFFSAGALGVRVKSPLDMALGLTADLGWSSPEGLAQRLRNDIREAGFDLFYPPDVAGWPEGRRWLDTGRTPLRGLMTDRVVSARTEARQFAQTVPTAADPYRFVADVAERLVSVPLSPALLAEGVTILLAGIPDYEWDPAVRSAEGRIRGLIQFLARLPEYQLA